jgi:hypothetical protein
VHRFETPGPVALRIAIAAGRVEVIAAESEQTEVDIVPLRDDETTRRAVEEARVEHIARAGSHEVIVESERSDWGVFRRGPKLGVTVRCPRGADLEVRTASASVRAIGGFGAVQAKTASGDVDVDEARSLSAGTASGDVAVVAVADECSVKTASGNARIGTAGGPLTVSLVSGNLRLDEARDSVGVSTVSGDQLLGAVSAGPVKLSSVSGDVRVGVQPGLRLYLDVGTVSGSANSDLESDDASPAGDGGEVLELRVRTVSGDARIERAAPMPPA